MHFLVHRMPWWLMKGGRCKVLYIYIKIKIHIVDSPWDGDPVQALKKIKKINNNTKILGTLKRPASKSIGCSIVQLGFSLFASLYYLCI